MQLYVNGINAIIDNCVRATDYTVHNDMSFTALIIMVDVFMMIVSYTTCT